MPALTCWRSYCAFLASLLLASCSGNQISEVSGNVTYDGVSVDDGSILFRASDGSQTTEYGGPIKNGQYTAKVPPGEMIVTVSWLKPTGKMKKAYDTPDSKEYPEKAEAIPEKYNTQTELRYDVKPGKHQKNWDLAK